MKENEIKKLAKMTYEISVRALNYAQENYPPWEALSEEIRKNWFGVVTRYLNEVQHGEKRKGKIS